MPKSETERILCVKVASRGDLLMAGPAFRQLRRERPDAHVTLLVGASCEDVARHLPFFDAVHTIDDRTLFGGGMTGRARAALALLRFFGFGAAGGGRARTPAFSEVVVFHRDQRYALLSWLARIPVRRGLAENSGSHFLTHPYHPREREHDTSQYLGLVCGARHDSASAPVPPLAGVWAFADGELRDCLAAAEAHGFAADARPYIALGFGGGANVKTETGLKCWPIERYRELASRLVDRGYGVVWLGDRRDAERLGSTSVGLNLAGALSVAGSAAVLRQCLATVANDTLLMHLSEAVGTSTLALFGPTDSAQYGPQGLRSAALWRGDALACSPCSRAGVIPPCPFGHRCMHDLSVDAVLDRLDPLLDAERGGVTAAGLPR